MKGQVSLRGFSVIKDEREALQITVSFGTMLLVDPFLWTLVARFSLDSSFLMAWMRRPNSLMSTSSMRSSTSICLTRILMRRPSLGCPCCMVAISTRCGRASVRLGPFRAVPSSTEPCLECVGNRIGVGSVNVRRPGPAGLFQLGDQALLSFLKTLVLLAESGQFGVLEIVHLVQGPVVSLLEQPPFLRERMLSLFGQVLSFLQQGCVRLLHVLPVTTVESL